MINGSLHNVTLYWGISCQRTLWMPEVYVGAEETEQLGRKVIYF